MNSNESEDEYAINSQTKCKVSVSQESCFSKNHESLNATPTNDVKWLHEGVSYHRHRTLCWHYEVIIHCVESVYRHKIPTHQLTPDSLDDGFLDDNISLLRCSSCSDRNTLSHNSSDSNFHDDGSSDGSDHFIDHLRSSRIIQREKCPYLPKFQSSFYQSFDKMIDCIIESNELSMELIQALNLRETHVKPELDKIFDRIFSDGVKWGKIVTVVLFISELVVCAQMRSRQILIDEILEVSVKYIDEHVWPWIAKEGGWQSIVPMDDADISSSLNEFISVLGGLAFVTVAGLALGRFLINRL